MTQIISVITREYAILASDRRLTFADGPRKGELFDDDTCKLVSLCNICGIGYTGLAQLEGIPTHKWIGHVLASANCHDAPSAAPVLVDRATQALRNVRPALARLTFVLTGWAQFTNPPGLRPHLCIISNMLDQHGDFLAEARPRFDSRVNALHDNKDFLWNVIGQPLGTGRSAILERNMYRLVGRQISPKEMLRILVDEIIHTAKSGCPTVGQKILGVCIPRDSVLTQLRSGRVAMLATQPNRTNTSFTYFDPSYSELVQFGPTFVCGEMAVTNPKVESDPSRQFQAVEVQILHVPKRTK